MFQSSLSFVKNRSSTAAIHKSQLGHRPLVLFQQPDPAGVALALLDQRLDEHPEKTGDVWLADEQIDRQLHGVALDAGHALGAAALVDFAGERVGPGLSRCRAHELRLNGFRALRRFTRAFERFAVLTLS